MRTSIIGHIKTSFFWLHASSNALLVSRQLLNFFLRDVHHLIGGLYKRTACFSQADCSSTRQSLFYRTTSLNSSASCTNNTSNKTSSDTSGNSNSQLICNKRNRSHATDPLGGEIEKLSRVSKHIASSTRSITTNTGQRGSPVWGTISNLLIVSSRAGLFTQSRASIKGFLGTVRSIRTHLTHATVESIQGTRKSSTTFIAYQTNTPSTNTTNSLTIARDGLVQQITTSLQSVPVCGVICIVSINTLVLGSQKSNTPLMTILLENLIGIEIQQVILFLSRHGIAAQTSNSSGTNSIHLLGIESLLLGLSGEGNILLLRVRRVSGVKVLIQKVLWVSHLMSPSFRRYVVGKHFKM